MGYKIKRSTSTGPLMKGSNNNLVAVKELLKMMARSSDCYFKVKVSPKTFQMATSTTTNLVTDLQITTYGTDASTALGTVTLTSVPYSITPYSSGTHAGTYSTPGFEFGPTSSSSSFSGCVYKLSDTKKYTISIDMNGISYQMPNYSATNALIHNKSSRGIYDNLHGYLTVNNDNSVTLDIRVVLYSNNIAYMRTLYFDINYTVPDVIYENQETEE